MFKGWKTRLVSLATFLSGLVVLVDPTMLSRVIPEDKMGWVFIGYAVVMYVLHEITLLENKPELNEPQEPP